VVGVARGPASRPNPRVLRAAGGVASLVLADVTQLPVPGDTLDAILAAGILTHVPDPPGFLHALARASKPGARLAVFQPIGRAALAARRHRTLGADDLLDAHVLPGVLAANGWALQMLDDGDDRYLALARRT
jgi:SAM-dependent methyltransferase